MSDIVRSDPGGAALARRSGAEPPVGIQRKWRELGRLRMGDTVPAGNGKKRPRKLDTWRVTSPSRYLIDKVAALYGGTPERWADAPNPGENWQVTTTASSLIVLVPPGQALTQFFELWKGGGCVKRCTGQRQVKADLPCSCPIGRDDGRSDQEKLEEQKRLAKDNPPKACAPATRIVVMLPGVPDLGVWRLDSHGYVAAEEMAGTFDVLRVATERGEPVPARLTITHRQGSFEDEKGQVRKSRFTVPALELDEQISQAIMDRLPSITLPERQGLSPPIERRSLPGPKPALSTSSGTPEQPGMFDTPAVATAPPDALPPWLDELTEPGNDGGILDAVNAILQEDGIDYECKSILDPHLLKASLTFQERLRAKLRGEDAETGGSE